MRLACSLFVVAPLWVLCSWGWVTDKCFVYDQDVHIRWQWDMECPTSKLTGRCENVRNIKLDLATVPNQVQVLCLQVVQGYVLHPDDLSRFQSLRSLYIQGCISAILPGAFKGLPNLHELNIFKNGEECCNSSLSAHIFSDLLKLEKLSFENYTLSTMAPDVFSGLNRLKQLKISNCVWELSEVLCRIVNITPSLTTLTVDSKHVDSLRQQNCTFFNGPVNHTLYGLEFVDFSFPSVKVIHKNVFKSFKGFSRLNIPLNDTLKNQLLQSGIKKVHSITISGDGHDAFDFGSICEIVFELSVTNISLVFADFKNYSLSSFMKCIGLRDLKVKKDFSESSSLCDFSFLHILRNVSQLELSWITCPHFPNLCKKQYFPVPWLTKLSIKSSVFKNNNSHQFSCLSNLEELIIENNGILVIEDFAFDGLSQLRVLSLGLNFISAVKVGHFSGQNSLVNLETLILSSNHISFIEDYAFQRLGSLRVLHLKNNKITKVKASHFFGLRSLECLTLQENPLMYIDMSSFSHLTSLQDISLNLNIDVEPTMAGLYLSTIFGDIPQTLTHLYFSTNARYSNLMIGSNFAPKQGFSLHIRGQLVLLSDCERPFFKLVSNLTAETEQLLCDRSVFSSHFSGRYFKSLEHFEISRLQNTELMELTELNMLVHLKSLTLRNIDLTQQPGLDIMFHNLTKLENLTLDNCWIQSLDGNQSKDLQSLRVLYVDREHELKREFSVVKNFPEPLKSLKYLIITNPLLHCSCANAWISNWAKEQPQVQVTVLGLGFENISCKDEYGTQNFQTYAQTRCFSHIEFLLFASTSLGLVVFILVVLLHHMAREYLLAFVHITRGWMRGVMRRNNRERYHYDAFVSYCGRDECWVVEELLPNLEQRGPPFLRLCLHSRDFQLGRDIVENIMDSLYSSRRTICLVSRHFLQSNWCSLEMRLATYRLLAEHRDILILVFLEEIPPHLLSAHHKLARLVKTRTYINWPEDPREHAAFWNRLWTKLAPDTEEYNNL